jgi:NAD(P)-dependent dehydrogenase (short-subunit alcohol dehydrogenase family)
MGELDDTTAAVWDDASGFGTAIAASLEAAGASVARDGGEDVDPFLAAAAEHLGGLDLAVICVGGPGPSQPLAETSDERWQRELDDHLGAAFRGIRRALNEMLPRGRGRILVTASVESKLPHPGAAPFVAAQHGVAGLVKSVAHEVGPAGVIVNALVCGPIADGEDADGLARIARGAIKRPNTPEEVAAAALALASPAMSSVTGTLFPVHGGMVPY